VRNAQALPEPHTACPAPRLHLELLQPRREPLRAIPSGRPRAVSRKAQDADLHVPPAGTFDHFDSGFSNPGSSFVGRRRRPNLFPLLFPTCLRVARGIAISIYSGSSRRLLTHRVALSRDATKCLHHRVQATRGPGASVLGRHTGPTGAFRGHASVAAARRGKNRDTLPK